jgi:hypothetical protein
MWDILRTRTVADCTAMPFSPLVHFAGIATCLAVMAAGTGCNEQRRQECDKFLGAVGPLREGTPGADAVDRVRADVAAIAFQDEPLREYAKNYQATLVALGNTLRLKEGAPNADAVPDGVNDVIKKSLKEARTDEADIARYCAP